MKPATVADPKDIDWEGSWKTYGEIFEGKAAEVGSPAHPALATQLLSFSPSDDMRLLCCTKCPLVV